MSKTVKVPKTQLQKFLALAEHKKYLEFFTALLSIPVLITVIILNFNSVKNLEKNAKPTDTPQRTGFYSAPIVPTVKSPTTQPLGTQAPCKKELGPISIESPQENDSVTGNPVSIIISYPDDRYCAAVWAYRINDSQWSDYDDKSIALYNLPTGKVKLELKAKSIVVASEKILTRNFTYQGASATLTPTVTQDQLGTSSAR